MALEFENGTGGKIRNEASAAYPHECCGFLMGRTDEEMKNKKVLEILPRVNVRTDSAHNRFLITPEDSMKAERTAREKGLDIVGYYHSHPDHPARPSQYDIDHALWPGYSSVIVNSQQSGRTGDLKSFVLTEDRKEMPEEPVKGDDPA